VETQAQMAQQTQVAAAAVMKHQAVTVQLAVQVLLFSVTQSN
jgi:hypothetical protein